MEYLSHIYFEGRPSRHHVREAHPESTIICNTSTSSPLHIIICDCIGVAMTDTECINKTNRYCLEALLILQGS